jgi:hypothetical protein
MRFSAAADAFPYNTAAKVSAANMQRMARTRCCYSVPVAENAAEALMVC